MMNVRWPLVELNSRQTNNKSLSTGQSKLLLFKKMSKKNIFIREISKN